MLLKFASLCLFTVVSAKLWVPSDSMPWCGYKSCNWPDKKRIPYDPWLHSPGGQAEIREVLHEIESHSCLRFAERISYGPSKDHSYILYWRPWNGCSSLTGYSPGRITDVNLGVRCRSKRDILHETCHAIGFQHEHQRRDRHHYLTIHNGGGSSGFSIRNEFDLTAPYDLTSIMHYGGVAMITTKDPAYQPETVWSNIDKDILEISYNLSFYDIMALNKAYECADHCSDKRPCKRHSFRGEDCQCYCSRFARQLADKNYRPEESMKDRILSQLLSKTSRTEYCEPAEVAFPKSARKKGESDQEYGCEDGWTRLNDYCYQLQPDVEMTWAEADGHCQALLRTYWEVQNDDAELTRSGSAVENDFLTQMLPEGNGFVGWLGAKKLSTNHPWMWTDNPEVFDKDQLSFRPYWRTDLWSSTDAQGAKCLQIHRDGWWAEVGCDRKAAAICRRPAINRPADESTNQEPETYLEELWTDV